MNKAELFFKSNEKSFQEVLKDVQEYISSKYAVVISKNKKTQEKQLKMYISKYLMDYNISVEEYTTEQLIEKLYAEMAEFSFLTPYLFSKDIEEININSWEDIKITFSNGDEVSPEEKFLSPGHALDVVRRLLQNSGMVLDYANPVVRGHIAGNIRITAFCPPVIDDEIGVVASIRLVNPKKLKIDDFVRLGTATEEMFNILADLSRYGISICVAGATTSGKTTLLDAILSTIPDDKRIYTIENNVREFNLIRRDKYGKITNSVVHTVTKESENPKEVVDQEKLLEYALTSNPDIIVVGEMKSAEAFAAQEAARTGHGVLSTVHSNSCEATYRRFITLCKQKYDMKDETLYTLVTEAFPIIVFTRRLEDKSRKIMEITECEILSNGDRKINTLYKYNVEDVIEVDGKKKVIGQFEKVNNISLGLQKRLLENGMQKSVLQKIVS
ncbi:ATPase, T2SS/T4P/T4SS family [Sporanaerobacter acetigenes]|uniref:Pilus assembly protein CpaF n=1 Tax=Sporanaerobacter acetigenes DSM 13106 TaxID=1123281 RepID=A0A1M5U816_9FIRM|nr:ATPase, T2SS/T4P/T4SS family [Sporanaerobacter acetigenes]SHH59060.1 pilus assembly protein CpaF [Sporanaerobacter acetigenes DSM 13106]